MDPTNIRNELALTLPEEEARVLADRIMSSVRAPSTLGIYTPIIQRYEEFAANSAASHSSLVFAFLTKNYLGKASFRTAAAALRLHFVAKGVSPSPLDSDAMALLRAAAEREKPKPAHRQKWLTSDLIGLATHLKQSNSGPDKRLRTLVLLNYATFMRPSEGVAIRVDDVTFDGSQMRIQIQKTKTNQNGPAQLAIVDELPDHECCPIKAVRAWIADPARRNSEWLFPNLNVVTEHIKVDRVQGEIRKLRSQGIIPEGFTLHGLRGGATTTCIEAGIPIDAVQRAGRWSNPNSMKPYIEKTTRTLQGTTNAIAAGLRIAQDDVINQPNPTEEQ